VTGSDVVVIGAGAVGASVAYELARRGASVTVVDQGPGVGGGCSYANAGLLSPSHVQPLATPANVAAGLRYMWRPDSPFYVRPSARLAPWLTRFVLSAGPRRARLLTERMRDLADRSLRLHGEYAGRGLATGFAANGALDVFVTERRFERVLEQLRTGRAHGTGMVLSADEARHLEPTLGDVAGAVFHPGEAQCDSLRFVDATLSAAQAHGAEVRWGTSVRRLEIRDGRIGGLETSAGRLSAGSYVLAAGLGSGRLSATAGIRVPMTGAKGYVIDVEVAGPAPRLPLTLAELRVVATPYPDRLRLCGTLELGSDSTTTSERRLEAIRAAGRRALPGLDVRKTIQTWAGLRPCTADGVPVIGRSERRDNLVVAAGHGMWGLVLAPVTGELVAQGVVEQQATLEDPDFAPDRFRARLHAPHHAPVHAPEAAR
jgi:D-amino-acid dehydrogenase